MPLSYHPGVATGRREAVDGHVAGRAIDEIPHQERSARNIKLANLLATKALVDDLRQPFPLTMVTADPAAPVHIEAANPSGPKPLAFGDYIRKPPPQCYKLTSRRCRRTQIRGRVYA